MSVEKEKVKNFFKLDTNLDGYYVNSDGDIKKIENVIQLVAGTDGSSYYPNDHSEMNFAKGEIAEREITDIDNNVNYKGHGLLYDKDGNNYANKGQLVFRTGEGIVKTLSDLPAISPSIHEKENLDLFLKDKSLSTQVDLRDKNGLELDLIIKAAQVLEGGYSPGNIKETLRASKSTTNEIEVSSSLIGDDDVLWIICRSDTATKLELVEEQLDGTEILLRETESTGSSVGTYITFLDKLRTVSEEVSSAEIECPIIYAETTKNFYLHKEGLENKKVIKLKDINGNSNLSLNVLVMNTKDDIEKDVIIKGTEVVKNADTVTILFDDELETTDYSIFLTPNEFCQAWPVSRDNKGFVINFERTFDGKVAWVAILN